VADADGRVQVPEAPLHELVEVNAQKVVVAEERVLSEHCLQAEALGRHQYHVLQDAHALVPMHYVHLLAHQDLAYERQGVEERDEGDVSVAHRHLGYVVDLHSVSHSAHTAPRALKLISNERNLVAPFYEALAQLVAVSLHAAKLGKRKVRAYQDAVLLFTQFADRLAVVASAAGGEGLAGKTGEVLANVLGEAHAAEVIIDFQLTHLFQVDLLVGSVVVGAFSGGKALLVVLLFPKVRYLSGGLYALVLLLLLNLL